MACTGARADRHAVRKYQKWDLDGGKLALSGVVGTPVRLTKLKDASNILKVLFRNLAGGGRSLRPVNTSLSLTGYIDR